MSAPAALVVTYGVLVGAGVALTLLRDACVWALERVWWGPPRGARE